MRNAITSRTRLLILNFPHNPTGAVLSGGDLDSLERIVEETGVLVISDEVYEHNVFDGVSHASLASRPMLAANSFVISSFGKTFHTTGWKIGYCCAPKSLSAELRKVHQFMVFTVSSPMQVALSTFLQDSAPYLELAAFYDVKRQLLKDGLKQTRFIPLPCASTFFMLADYSAISVEPEAEFARWLTTSHGVGVIPVSAFYAQPDATASNHHLVRLCFAKNGSTLRTAIERLMAI